MKMCKMRTMINHLDSILKLIRDNVPQTQGVYIYGSVARNQENASSDIDLAVLAANPLPGQARFELAQKIAQTAGRDVDLVDLRSVSTVFQFEILTGGERLAAFEPAACDHFETLVYTSYARLNEERKGILDDIQKRGKIYE